MTLEDSLRDHLQRQADDIPLPDREPGRAVSRARARRRNRQVGAGVVAVAALAAGLGIPRIAGDGDAGDPVSVRPADSGAGLPLTGPLTFDWQSTDGGLSGLAASFQADDGTVYALSTGPGVRYEDHPDGDYPRALYRLAEDGTWEAVPLDGERPDANDVATDGSLLYAVSTGPDGNGGYAPRLSTSSDRGDSWSVQDIEAAAPPSDVIPWLKSSSMAIESSGDTTLAVVSTSFRPNQEAVFPQLQEPGAYGTYQAVPQADGFALVEMAAPASPADIAARIEGATARGQGPPDGATGEIPPVTATTPVDPAAPTTTAVDPTGAPTTTTAVDPAPPPTTPPTFVDGEVPPDVITDPSGAFAEPTVVELVPWSDLGVSGIEALGTQHQVFERTADAWEPLEVTGLDGVSNLGLTVSGGRFVATGYPDGGGYSAVLTSSDGATWSPVSSPAEGQVVGVGSALVALPYDQSTVVQVSPDGGATWSEVDLAAFGVAAGQYITAADAGPLGLAFVTMPSPSDPTAPNGAAGAPAGSGPQLVVSGDLVDWTVTPLADVAGTPVTANGVTVGADRVVVSASPPRPDLSAPIESVTLVGTPVRQG